MSRRKINDDVIKFIRDNCTISAAHLKESIKDKFGVELSLPSIYRYLREFRENTQIETSAINEEIKHSIASRIRSQTDPLLQIMENEIKRLHDIINDKNNDYVIPLDKSYVNFPDMVPKSRSHYWLIRYENMLFESIKIYMSLRPNNVEIDVNLKDKSTNINEILDEYFNDDDE